MKVSIIGSGVVGKATGLAFAAAGHDVVFYDIDRVALKPLPPWAAGTTSLSFAAEHAEALVLCLPTPSDSYGSCDTSCYETVFADLVKLQAHQPGRHTLFVQKSTLPPGTANRLTNYLFHHAEDTAGSVGYVVNPEFLNAGAPLRDAIAPAKVVLGVGDDDEAARALKLYPWVPKHKIHIVSRTEAELIKYTNNLFHAATLSLWNELYTVADALERLGYPEIDMDRVARLTALEPGLESVYRVFGKAWGGACLPKDTKAFRDFARAIGVPVRIVEATIAVNEQMRAVYGEQTKHWDELHK